MDLSQKYIYWILLFSFIFLSGLLTIENFQDDYELCDSNIGYCLNENPHLNATANNISNEHNNYKNTILTESERKDLLEKLKKKPKKDWRDKHACFSVPDGKKTSINTKEKCEENQGIWDKPCKADFDCPYYARNKNSEKSKKRGGCKMGTCEFPANMKRIGYTKFLPEEKHLPYCKNCHLIPDYQGSTTGPCCQNQKNLLNIIPLKTPDYFY